MDATETLTEFAAAVLAAAARVPASGRFGDRKVFVSAVWDALSETARDGLSLDSFKRQLFIAHRLGLLMLMLARADLVAAMPAASVTASQIGYDGIQFHFVLDPTVRDSWAADDGHDEPQQSGGKVRHEPTVRAGLVPRRGTSGLSLSARVMSPARSSAGAPATDALGSARWDAVPNQRHRPEDREHPRRGPAERGGTPRVVGHATTPAPRPNERQERNNL